MLDMMNAGLEAGRLPKAEGSRVNNPAVRRKRMSIVADRSTGEKGYEQLISTIDYNSKKKKLRYKNYMRAQRNKDEF